MAETEDEGSLPLELAARLRGLSKGCLLACATLSNPRSASHHAELVPHSASRARGIYRLLTRIGCIPRIINRNMDRALF